MTRGTVAQSKDFQSVVSDVVWRFHVYHQYQHNPTKALRALGKRMPGYSMEFIREQFELHLQLLMATIEAVEHTPKTPQLNQLYSEYTDVDTQLIIHKLQLTFPAQPEEFLKTYLGMVIYWFHLR